MKRILLVVALVLMLRPGIALAQDPTPACEQLLARIQHLEQQNDAILAVLSNGVTLNSVQGSVQFGQVRIMYNADHDGALVIRNNAPGGYGLWTLGDAVGIITEGRSSIYGTGLWSVGQATGAVVEGNRYDGLQLIGNKYGASFMGAQAPITPTLECQVKKGNK